VPFNDNGTNVVQVGSGTNNDGANYPAWFANTNPAAQRQQSVKLGQDGNGAYDAYATFTAVPEPSQYAFLLGIATIGFIGYRVRMKRHGAQSA